MISELQKAFESRASELGYSIRKSESGDYIYKPTGKLWGWYQAGAHSVLEYTDANFDMVGHEIEMAQIRSYNQAYEG